MSAMGRLVWEEGSRLKDFQESVAHGAITQTEHTKRETVTTVGSLDCEPDMADFQITLCDLLTTY